MKVSVQMWLGKGQRDQGTSIVLVRLAHTLL